ncbi:MAG: AAA family ATPase [Leptospiraceae bacterium]|nr:AAA family ATPase [Leptospiraceae bacterium]
MNKKKPKSNPEIKNKEGRIISISNQKGGEGKTTISLFLSEALSWEARVLIVDWDAQANTSSQLVGEVEFSIFDCLGYRGAPAKEPKYVIRKITESLDLLPASISLANFTTPFGVEDFSLLKDVLEKLKSSYDFIIIDCPPSLGLSLENALIASDFVLVPIQTRAFSVQGISDLYSTIEKIRQKANGKLKLLGAVFNLFEGSRALSGLSEGIKKYFPVFETTIPRREGIPQAQVKKKLLQDCEKGIKKVFTNLANEVREKTNV